MKKKPLDNDSWMTGFTRDSFRGVIRYDSVRFLGGSHGITILPKAAAPSTRFQVWTKELLSTILIWSYSGLVCFGLESTLPFGSPTGVSLPYIHHDERYFKT